VTEASIYQHLIERKKILVSLGAQLRPRYRGVQLDPSVNEKQSQQNRHKADDIDRILQTRLVHGNLKSLCLLRVNSRNYSPILATVCYSLWQY
jgi:hypothetical protein